MNAKLFALLLVVTGVVGGSVYWFVVRPSYEEHTTRAEAGLLFPELAERSGEIASIRIINDSGSLELKKDGDTWVLPSKEGYPAKLESIRELTFALSSMTRLEQKTANPAYHERLGLNRPEPDSGAGDAEAFGTPAPTEIVISDAGGGVIIDAIVGDASYLGSDTFTFIRRGDEDQCWQSKGRIEAPAKASSWYEHAVVKVARDDVASVRVGLRDAEPYGIARKAGEDGAPGAFEVVGLPEGRALKSPTIANQLANALAFINAEDIRRASPDNFPETTDKTVFAQIDGPTITVRRSAGSDPTWVTFEAEGDGADEINEAVGGWAFKLAEFASASIFKPIDDLLAPVTTPDEIPDAVAPAGPDALTPPQPASQPEQGLDAEDAPQDVPADVSGDETEGETGG